MPTQLFPAEVSGLGSRAFVKYPRGMQLYKAISVLILILALLARPPDVSSALNSSPEPHARNPKP